MKHWQTKTSQVVYKNPWISVREDQVIRPDGNDGIYGVVSLRDSAVCVVPVDDEGNTYIVLQERYTTGLESWETIVGGADGQPLEQAARRELLEEAGLATTSLEKISEFYTMNGISDHKMVIFIATDLQKVTDELDPVDGIIAAKKLPLKEVKDMILRNEITDGPTVTAILTVIAYWEQNK